MSAESKVLLAALALGQQLREPGLRFINGDFLHD